MTKTLYKRRADGGIQLWNIYVHADGTRYNTTSGILDGEKVTSEWTYVEGKNIGRSNETTDKEQCQKDVEAIIKKKLNQGGYHESTATIDKPKFIKPMLAKVADLDRIEKHLNSSQVYMQPKLDGIRCIATKGGLSSRTGKPILSCDHIREALKPYFEKNPTAILDGELYNHDLRDDFNEIVSAVRKTTNLDPLQASKVQYHIYDIIDTEFNFLDRYMGLVTDTPGLDSDVIQLVNTVNICNMNYLVEVSEHFLAAGYEGSMVRYDEPYQLGKRNWILQKIKQFFDEEFIVVGFEEGKGNAEGLAVKCVIETNDGVKVYPTMMGTVEYRTHIWDNPEQFIGKTCTIKHMGYTKDGSLRHPNCKRIHTSERDDH